MARNFGCCMCANAFSTSTPKPRAEGSNPSAPATEKSLETALECGFWRFLSLGGHGLAVGVGALVLGVIFASGAVCF